MIQPLQTQLWPAKMQMCCSVSGTYDSNHYYLLPNKRKRRLVAVFHFFIKTPCWGVVWSVKLSSLTASLGQVYRQWRSWTQIMHCANTRFWERWKEAEGWQHPPWWAPGEMIVLDGHILISWSQHGWAWLSSFSWLEQFSCQEHEHPLSSPCYNAPCSARLQECSLSFSFLLNHWGHLTHT